MPREAGPELQKVTLNLLEGDREILAAFFPGAGWSVAARTIIHKYCMSLLEEEARQKAQQEAQE